MTLGILGTLQRVQKCQRPRVGQVVVCLFIVIGHGLLSSIAQRIKKSGDGRRGGGGGAGELNILMLKIKLALRNLIPLIFFHSYLVLGS